jgi:hypothetical protein
VIVNANDTGEPRITATSCITASDVGSLMLAGVPTAVAKVANVPTAVAKVTGVPTAVEKVAGVPTAVAKVAGVPTADKLDPSPFTSVAHQRLLPKKRKKISALADMTVMKQRFYQYATLSVF